CWLRGEARGELVRLTRQVVDALSPAPSLVQVVEAFRHKGGRRLTGYEDGPDNPLAVAAVEAAVLSGRRPGDAWGRVAVLPPSVPYLEGFEKFPAAEQDDIFGRRKSDNEELEDAPEFAHVKRTAQESFEPEAFMVRRSMAWAEGAQ